MILYILYILFYIFVPFFVNIIYILIKKQTQLLIIIRKKISTRRDTEYLNLERSFINKKKKKKRNLSEKFVCYYYITTI